MVLRAFMSVLMMLTMLDKCIYKSAKEQTIPFQLKPISGYAPCSYWRIGFEIGFNENSNMFNMALCHLLLCTAYSGHWMPYGTQWPPMQLSPFLLELQEKIIEHMENAWSPEAQSSLIDSDVVNFVLAHGSLGIGCVLILTGALKLETTIQEAHERAFQQSKHGPIKV